MTVLYKSNRVNAGSPRPVSCVRPAPAPALYRLLADSALSRAALDACGFGIALLDAQGPVMPLSYANRAVERMTGTRADLLVGLPAAEALFVEPDSLLLAVLARQAEATCAPAIARARLRAHRDRNGSIEVDIALNAVRDVGGGVEQLGAVTARGADLLKQARTRAGHRLYSVCGSQSPISGNT